MQVAAKVNLLDLTPEALEALVVGMDEPPYRVRQLVQWIHQRGVIDFSQMTDLSKAFRAKLAQLAMIALPEIALERRASDGVHKWLLRLHDGNCIEMVFIPERTRGTLCVSSQVGCALNCSFCSTGKEGFNRNLELSEIIGQVWLARDRGHNITNVVMMGMGEPLLNYQPVIDAMRLMMNDCAYGLSKRRVTLSTSGVVPKMEQLKRDCDCALAVSLHAPTNSLRDELVPLNKKYPLETLIPVCANYYPKGSKRVVTFEYVMLDGVNDSLQEAQALVQLLAGVPCKINLIPFNPFPKTHYQTSSETSVLQFQQYLIKAGFNTRVRRTRGDDVEGACGQLAGQIQDRTGRHQRWLRTGRLIPVDAGSTI